MLRVCTTLLLFIRCLRRSWIFEEEFKSPLNNPRGVTLPGMVGMMLLFWEARFFMEMLSLAAVGMVFGGRRERVKAFGSRCFCVRLIDMSAKVELFGCWGEEVVNKGRCVAFIEGILLRRIQHCRGWWSLSRHLAVWGQSTRDLSYQSDVVTFQLTAGDTLMITTPLVTVINYLGDDDPNYVFVAECISLSFVPPLCCSLWVESLLKAVVTNYQLFLFCCLFIMQPQADMRLITQTLYLSTPLQAQTKINQVITTFLGKPFLSVKCSHKIRITHTFWVHHEGDTLRTSFESFKKEAQNKL